MVAVNELIVTKYAVQQLIITSVAECRKLASVWLGRPNALG